jgi:hypothetical protein
MRGYQGGVRDTLLLRLRFLGRELVSFGEIARLRRERMVSEECN